MVKVNFIRSSADEFNIESRSLQKAVEMLRFFLQELAIRREDEDLPEQGEENLIQAEKSGRDESEFVEETMRFRGGLDLMGTSASSPLELEADAIEKRLHYEAIPKFVTKFGIMMKWRALRLGQQLYAQYKRKGAVAMFESIAAIESATR